MRDSVIRTTLTDRLLEVDQRIEAACARAGRRRDEITLVAVTKTVAPEVAAVACELGVPNLGEGRPQELARKATAVRGAFWHLVGHLQRNKISTILPHLHLLHSVDSLRLLQALNDAGIARQQPVPVLLEINVSREEQKHGFAPEELPALADQFSEFAGLRIDGVMTMARLNSDPEAARPTFAELRTLRDQLRARSGFALPQLSMGMSGDFEVAIEEGATLVRIGTTLFHGLGPT